MSESKFKTMRHIEAVRNYLVTCVNIILDRSIYHDQSKLGSPEVEIFEEYTPKLRDCTYGSEEYGSYLKEMKIALDHHYCNNRHHPEYHAYGIDSMNLFDILEMLIDWKAASMRHNDGDIHKSIQINKKRFEFSDEFAGMLSRTIDAIEERQTFHKANES